MNTIKKYTLPLWFIISLSLWLSFLVSAWLVQVGHEYGDPITTTAWLGMSCVSLALRPSDSKDRRAFDDDDDDLGGYETTRMIDDYFDDPASEAY